jgi:hypothetical protein
MVWVDSPLAGQREAARLVVQRHRRVLGVDDQDWRKVDELFCRDGAAGGSAFDCGESVFPQIREAVQGDVDRQLRARVAPAVWTEVMGVMRDPGVSAGIWCAAWRRFTRPVYEALGGAERARPILKVITVYGGRGQHDVQWLGFCAFFEAIRVVEGTGALEPLRQLAGSCGVWWAFEHVAILTERPRLLVLDEDECPHSESGPAVEYSDGFGYHAWHGATVPKGTVIDIGSMTTEKIDAEPDGLLRAAMIDRFGKRRYLDAKGAKLLHEEKHWGAIYRVTTDHECTALHEMGTGSCCFRPVSVAVQTGRQAWAVMARQNLHDNDNSNDPPFGVG